ECVPSGAHSPLCERPSSACQTYAAEGGATWSAQDAGRSLAGCNGSVTVKVVPCPGALSTAIEPPWASTASLQKVSPSPVLLCPAPPRPVAPKRSKSRRCCSG